MAVVKVRGSGHSKDLRSFEITDEGVIVGKALGRYEGLLTGNPDVIGAPSERLARRPRPRR
jgi:circadian clock protein KaiC